MKRKKGPFIKTKPTFAIIVDGECEVWYFQMLKRNERKLTVNIKPDIPQKKSLESQFEEVKKLSEYYDKVFWVLDLDVIIKESRENSKKKNTSLNSLKNYISQIESKLKNVVVIINTPCLEYWFLLHQMATCQYYNVCSDVIKELKKHLSDYSKTQNYFTKQHNDIYFRLKKHLKFAIENAKMTGEFESNNPYKGLSEMYKFFEVDEIHKSIF